ncbi:MAG: hypothetical protein ACOCZ7_05110, partial [Armatimonadota bacterium]
WLMRVSLLGHPLLGAMSLTVDFTIETQLRFLVQTVFDPLYLDATNVYPSLIDEEAWWVVPAFWEAVIADTIFIVANVTLAVTNPHLLGVLWAWRVITYLPSMPFCRMWDFYYYIPTLGTAVLYGVAATILARKARPHVQSWRREGANTDGTEEKQHARRP